MGKGGSIINRGLRHANKSSTRRAPDGEKREFGIVPDSGEVTHARVRGSRGHG